MHSWLNRTARDERGSITLLFAFGLATALILVGFAVDVGTAVRTRLRLQNGLDGAVLAASNVAVADDQRQSKFDSFLAANVQGKLGTIDSKNFVYNAGTGGTGTASLSIPTTFLRLIGVKNITVKTSATAYMAAIDLEVVFALDISGSMQFNDMGGGSRLNALKSSVSKMVDIIMQNKTASQKVKFAMVPFNMAVNIGTDNIGIVDDTSNPLFNGTTWAGCVLERRGAYASTDDYSAGASNGSGRWQAYIWPPAPNGSGRCLNKSNGTNSGYSSVEPAPLGTDPWMDGPNFNCPRYPMQRLTSSDSDIVSAVNGLQAYGNMGTTVGPAVGWAMRILSPTGPFAEGAPFDGKTRKIIIVVTDGEMVTDGMSCAGATNTVESYKFDPSKLQLDGRVLTSAPTNDSFTPYGYLQDSDPYNRGLVSALDANKELDRLSVAACDAAKSRSSQYPIEVFTIAASTGAGPGTRAETVLSKCASNGNFYYAADSTSLDEAFAKIAGEALRLRITK